jgi:hypothetical protein
MNGGSFVSRDENKQTEKKTSLTEPVFPIDRIEFNTKLNTVPSVNPAPESIRIRAGQVARSIAMIRGRC